MTATDRVLTGAGTVVGVAMCAVAGARRRRAIHPRGATYAAVLERHSLPERSGVPWLDDRGELDAVVRFSRGVGLPPHLPDVLGLALRVCLEAGPVDLLLSSCGRGVLTRSLLVPRRDATTDYSSLMTYGSPLGRVSLLAVADSPAMTAGGVLVLAAAFGFGPVEPYARLRLTEELSGDGADPRRAFDAVRHAPPGLRADGLVARFRTPAYALARRGRDARLSWPVLPVTSPRVAPRPRKQG